LIRVDAILKEATAVLQAAGIESARREAGSLLAYTLKVDRTYLLTNPDALLNEETINRYRAFIKRRAAREPLQYITCQQEFYGLDFEVTPDVLIPRPETEMIVERSLDLLRDMESPFICDLGTGSGCIIISIVHEHKDAFGIGLDISIATLSVAKRNVDSHSLSSRVRLLASDGFSAINTRFNLIVSNPPYIAASEIDGLQPEVRNYEPNTALTPGEDGLRIVRYLLEESPNHLLKGGSLLFEIGYDQSSLIESLIDKEVWTLVDIYKDLQGIPRTVQLRLKD
jgi:release factor glutamine methyltransferase